MIKFLFLGRRAAGLTRQSAQAHLRDVHGRMVVLPPADAGAMPAYYAQNHVIDGAYPAPGGAHGIERDLVTELNFDSMAAMQAAVATRYYRENLRPDEPRFVDDATVARVNLVPRPLLVGPRERYRLFLFLGRGPDANDDRWRAACLASGEAVAALNGIVALTENAVASPPGGTPFVDVVYEAWLDDRDAALAAAARARPLLAAEAIDSARSLMIVAEEFTEQRLRTLLA